MLWSGFILGFLGSFHCALMCGPIVMALPDSGLGRAVLYNSGRLITYVLLGLMFGSLGLVASFYGLQNVMSIVAGSIVLFMMIVSLYFKRRRTSGVSKAVMRMKKPFQRLLYKRNAMSLLLLGMLNGALPCGLVYIALAASIAYSGMLESGIYMLFFGLGTFPMMLIAHLSKRMIGQNMRMSINKSIPYISMIIGVMFILRGLSLGIPYLSPDVKIEGKQVHAGCCHKPKE